MNTGKHMILFIKKGSFDRESLVALWAKLPTRLKQVKTNMIKQKDNKRADFILLFWQISS
jgi:hypothetical protein